MGKWTLESVIHRTSLHDTAELFGNHYIVGLRLRYQPGKSFVEMPMLDWHEVIMMNEHHKGECWTFSANMYAHNPTSKTLEVWPKRYIEAYNTAAGQPTAGIKGSASLLDAQGKAVNTTVLGTKLTKDADKAEAVRAYLKTKGGVMMIEIDDIPSINAPRNNEHKERLLIFDCGVVGGGPRVKACQYLVVDHARPRTQWVRSFDLSHTRTKLGTTGLRNVAAPPQVANPRTDQPFFPGEYK